MLGGWLGGYFLAPFARETLSGWEFAKEGAVSAPVWIAASALIGAVLGWLAGGPLNYILGWSFLKFNQGFDRATDWYTHLVGWSLRVSVVVVLLYGGFLWLTYWTFQSAPAGFIPAQDKGYLVVNVQLPDAASVERTRAVMGRIEKLALADGGVKHTVAVSGQSVLLGANAPNFGAMYVMLKDFHQRTNDPKLAAEEISRRLQEAFKDEIPEGIIHVIGSPPIDGLGTAGGFKIILEDRADLGNDALQDAAEKLVEASEGTLELKDPFTSFRANTPWLLLDIDRTQAHVLGVNTGDLFATLQVYLGSLYVNDFNRFDRTWQVNVQAQANFRKQVEDLHQLQIRNAEGNMVPFSALATVKNVRGPIMLTRYNLYPCAAINASSAPGFSSGQTIAKLEELVKNSGMPAAMRYEWTELAYLQLQTGNTAYWVFLLAVVLVFLVLAAQYESWTLPLAVILVVPMCLLSSIAGVLIAGMDINIFTQIGFVVLVGLASKNAILIVEFAKARREAGATIRQATLDACHLRLRPIMMTSLAFILGVVPLVLSQGAGAEMRRLLGTAVFAGMLGVTLFGVFLTPVFYFAIQWLAECGSDQRGDELPSMSA